MTTVIELEQRAERICEAISRMYGAIDKLLVELNEVQRDIAMVQWVSARREPETVQ